MDLPELAADARFADFEARGQHRDELLAILSGRFAERSTAEWLDRLRGIVPIAPVRSLEQALDVDELRSRSMLAEYDHDSFGVGSLDRPAADDEPVRADLHGRSVARWRHGGDPRRAWL